MNTDSGLKETKSQTSQRISDYKTPVVQTSQRDTPSLHGEALAIEASNNWPWAYALGYASGLEDARKGRKSDHSTSENDDYALGYHKGFARVSQSSL